MDGIRLKDSVTSSRRQDGTVDSIAYRASMSAAHSCSRKYTGRYASTLPRARSRHWHFPVNYRDTAPYSYTPARRLQDRGEWTEWREARHETKRVEGRARTNKRVKRGQAVAASRQTDVESITLNIGCKIVISTWFASASRDAHTERYIRLRLSSPAWS